MNSGMWVTPEALTEAASNLTTIHNNLTDAHNTIPTQTPTMAADEISTAITTVFNTYARDYKTINTHAAAYHQQFAQNLTAAANTYHTADTYPVGVGSNILAIQWRQHQLRFGIGDEWLTIQWGWKKI